MCYWVFEEDMVDEDGNSFHTFGIRCEQFSISDVSLSREKASGFADSLNRGEASGLHFKEMVEDFVIGDEDGDPPM